MNSETGGRGQETVGVIARLMRELGKLPGIGPKTAERLTHHLLAAGRAQVLALADALRDDQGTDPPVPAVLQPDRGRSVLPVCGSAAGRLAHLRGGATARRGGAGTVGDLPRPVPRPARPAGPAGRHRSGKTDDRPPDAAGSQAGGGARGDHGHQSHDWKETGRPCTCPACSRRWRSKLTRLARGLPSGSVLEFANNQMLADALVGRRTF